MQPAHAYQLRPFPICWVMQTAEITSVTGFPGPIIVTTGIIEPCQNYRTSRRWFDFGGRRDVASCGFPQ
jgi:hypothetical protein